MEFQIVAKIAISFILLWGICLYVFYKFISLFNEDYENLSENFVKSQSKEFQK